MRTSNLDKSSSVFGEGRSGLRGGEGKEKEKAKQPPPKEEDKW